MSKVSWNKLHCLFISQFNSFNWFTVRILPSSLCFNKPNMAQQHIKRKYQISISLTVDSPLHFTRNKLQQWILCWWHLIVQHYRNINLFIDFLLSAVQPIQQIIAKNIRICCMNASCFQLLSIVDQTKYLLFEWWQVLDSMGQTRTIQFNLLNQTRNPIEKLKPK